MRESWNFICWSLRRWTFWDHAYAVGMVLLIASWLTPEPYGFWVSAVALTVFSTGLLKFAVWDMIKWKYSAYKKEQQEILDILAKDHHA